MTPVDCLLSDLTAIAEQSYDEAMYEDFIERLRLRLYDAITAADWSFVAAQRLSNLAKALTVDAENSSSHCRQLEIPLGPSWRRSLTRPRHSSTACGPTAIQFSFQFADGDAAKARRPNRSAKLPLGKYEGLLQEDFSATMNGCYLRRRHL